MFVAFKTLFAVIKNSRLPDPKISLGRWNTVYNRSTLDKRIDLSNEDHCGPCGQYILEKNIFSKPIPIMNEYIRK